MLAAWSMTGLTVLVEPAFYQRVFAAKDSRSVQRALFVGIALWASYDWGVTLIGLVGRAAVERGMLPGDLAGKESLLAVCLQMLPLGMRGLFIGGILAAAMSTIDSYSLLASGNVVYDIYRPLVDPNAPDRRLLRMTRGGVFLVMAASAAVSLYFVRMREIWQFMTSVMTSVVLVPVLAALFFRPRPEAGLCSAVAGFVGLIAFYGSLHTFGQYNSDHEAQVLELGNVEIWQDYAALCALPISLVGYFLGQHFGRRDA
jgi:Na+/proline symporter